MVVCAPCSNLRASGTYHSHIALSYYQHLIIIYLGFPLPAVALAPNHELRVPVVKLVVPNPFQ